MSDVSANELGCYNAYNCMLTAVSYALSFIQIPLPLSPSFAKFDLADLPALIIKYLVEEIHTTIVATVDDDGLPETAAIDMMDYDDNSIYFLTAKRKSFYNRLKSRVILPLRD